MTNKSTKIRQFILNTLGHPDIIEYAKNLGYSKENILILQGDERLLFDLYPETKRHLENCVHNRDMRTLFEYAEDLVYSWLMEDYIFNILKNNFTVKHYGGDKERSIKPAVAITSQSDLLIYNNSGEPISLEITNDYTGLFVNRKICNFRDFKFQNLKSNSLKQQTLILGVDMINKEFFIIDVSKYNSIKKIDSHPPFGGKSAFELDLENIPFFEFTPSNLLKIFNLYINR